MNKIHITRTVQLPDSIRISRYCKAPELGPRILFFSGGSALTGASRELKNYTHNSIHLVTPYDSGGSSAVLRKSFDMPSIGDLRSRLMALADETITGHPEIYELFTFRLSSTSPSSLLIKQLESMAQGKHPLVKDITQPMRSLICNQLGYFQMSMPEDFNLQGASIGNLILTGGYLNNHQHLDPIIFLFSKLVGVRGVVRAVVNDKFHLMAELEDGQQIVGQHRLTGKEAAPIEQPIKQLYLSSDVDKYIPVKSKLRKKNRKLIEQAELICYPIGSYYSSMIANLLPEGVARAISLSDAPKVFIPNLGKDPEQFGMSLDQSVQTLLNYLKIDELKNCPTEKLLNFVLYDSKQGGFSSKLSRKYMEQLGIQVIDTKLISKKSAPYYDDKLLVQALLSLT